MFVLQHPSSTGHLLSLGLSDLSPSTLGHPPNPTSEAYPRGRPTDTRIFSSGSHGRVPVVYTTASPIPKVAQSFTSQARVPSFPWNFLPSTPNLGLWGGVCRKKERGKAENWPEGKK